jgi:cbb3-type cytochrome oxidase subunit 3
MTIDQKSDAFTAIQNYDFDILTLGAIFLAAVTIVLLMDWFYTFYGKRKEKND